MIRDLGKFFILLLGANFSLLGAPRTELNAELERYTIAHRLIFHAETMEAATQAELDREAQRLIESLPTAPLRVVLVTSESPGKTPLATLKALPDAYHHFDEARFATLWQQAEAAVPAELKDILRYLAAWKNLAERAVELRAALTEKTSASALSRQKVLTQLSAVTPWWQKPLSWLVAGGVALVSWGLWLRRNKSSLSVKDASPLPSKAKKISLASTAVTSHPPPAKAEVTPVHQPAEPPIFFPETTTTSPLGAPSGGFLMSEIQFGSSQNV
jgi:hypothetical protein